jgi:signal transduction histidine kinase
MLCELSEERLKGVVALGAAGAAVKESLTEIGEARTVLKSLADLVNDFLLLARLENSSRPYPIKHEPFLMMDLCKSVSAVCSHLATDAGLTFTMECPNNLQVLVPYYCTRLLSLYVMCLLIVLNPCNTPLTVL